MLLGFYRFEVRGIRLNSFPEAKSPRLMPKSLFKHLDLSLTESFPGACITKCNQKMTFCDFNIK